MLAWTQMKKNISLSKTLLLISLILLSPKGQTADFEWSGIYTVEGNHIKNSELDGRGRELDYGLHHLSLRPKIVAGDGITIYGQFELFTNSTYPNSQLGSYMGDGIGVASPTDADNSNTLASHEKSEAMLISQLYLSWVHDYGALIVGRAPLQFGLGMSYSAGKNLFDHWFDTRDLVGYKIMMGNLYILPMYGKVAEKDINTNEDVNDYMVQVQYENPETDLEMGVFYRVRKSSDAGSNAPIGTDLIGGTGATRSPTNFNELSVYTLRDTERFRLGLEGSFLSGKIGARTAAGDNVTLNGFGVAGEFEYRPESSKWSFGSKTGMATGDDPESNSRFEGYAFDRNYKVAMLLFNHPLGRQDVLRTKVFGGGPDATGNINKPDVESVSNVIYLSPYAHYRWTDKLTVNSSLTMGWLNTDPQLVGDVGKNLGYEVDLSLNFSPRKGVMWVNEVGMLFPGSAFTLNDDKPSFAYGFTSKAAISF